MDPNSGKLYPSLEDALRAGVEKPVELIGRPEDIERISLAVKRLNKAEKKAKRRQVEKSRKKNR
jgi:predicted RNA-binding protein with RPS1 domain